MKLGGPEIFPASLHLTAVLWPLRLEYFSATQTILLFAALALPIVWLGVRSLAGLGKIRRWFAVAARLLLMLLLVLILAGARWQRENKIVEVVALRDVSDSVQNVRNFTGENLNGAIVDYLRKASDPSHKTQPDDRIGLVSFDSEPLIDAMPSPTLSLATSGQRSGAKGTDLAAAIQLGLATFKLDAMHRLILISDGNATQGDLDSAIDAATAAHVPIDVMPLDYDVQNEALVDRFIAPTWKRENEPFTLEVMLRSTNPTPTHGMLSVTRNGEPMDLDPNSPGVQPAVAVTLQPGQNVERITVPPLGGGSGVHQFHATFEPAITYAGAITGDTLAANNSADAFTFVRGKGKILYIDNVPQGRGQLLRDALTQEGIELDSQITSVSQFPSSLLDLQSYDSVILANVPRGADGLSEEQQKLLATYVHDTGGGLVMIGGENSFGAGGWQGSALEQILPVKMDIPARRVVPRGALILVIDRSGSMAEPMGDRSKQEIVEDAAVLSLNTLSSQDMVGVIAFDTNPIWIVPLAQNIDPGGAGRAMRQMGPGGGTSIGPALAEAASAMEKLPKSAAAARHVLLLTDGRSEQADYDAIIARLAAVGCSVSTVGVGNDVDAALLTHIAIAGKGNYYPVSDPKAMPQVFIKEATIVRRSLIFEDEKGIEIKSNGGLSSDLTKGLSTLPPIFGMVLTGRKDDPQIDLPLVAGKSADPLLADWQSGLGRAAVWTSDAYNKWAAPWVASGEYEKFWAQVVRSVSRPPMSADFDVKTTQNGDKGKITVEALDKENAFLNFLSIAGSVVGPDMKDHPIRLVQSGPGTYEAEFDAPQQGNYVAALNYRGANNQAGMLLSGMAVNGSAELRDLKSNDVVLTDVARRTGGRMLDPFNPETANMFDRAGLLQTASPLPIWDILIPIAIGLLLIDVAVRRIAWDFIAMQKSAVNFVRSFTAVRKVETKDSVDALRRIREGASEIRSVPPPDRSRKFESSGVEGDITQLVGAAHVEEKPQSDSPAPAVSQNQRGDRTAGLMAAKRRAREQMNLKERDR